jgi:sugar/nucleoside kinase (ribokinase family)
VSLRLTEGEQGSVPVVNQRDYEVLVAGYVGLDLTPQWADGAAGVAWGELLRPGRLVEVGALGVAAGGVVANTGLALRQWGVKVALSGLVGETPWGSC